MEALLRKHITDISLQFGKRETLLKTIDNSQELDLLGASMALEGFSE